MAKDDKVIRDAQYRKGLSIAWFNANNNAIALVAATINSRGETLEVMGDEAINIIKRTVVLYRDWFLEEHKTYYAQNIANIGLNYNQTETIATLKQATNYPELKKIWVTLSEDERQDLEILRVVKELKASYEKA